MVSSKIEELFKKCDENLTFNEQIKFICNQNIEQKNFFLENFKKDKNVINEFFKYIGYYNILQVEGNLENLKNILASKRFIKLFKESNLLITDLAKILELANNSSKYFIENKIIEQKNKKIVLERIKRLTIDFYNESEKIMKFESWYYSIFIEKMNFLSNENIIYNIEENELEKIKSSLDYISNFKLIMEDYISDLNVKIDSEESIRPNEKNKEINYFIRELNSLFNQKINNNISIALQIELVSIIYNKEISQTSINNILSNKNNSIANIHYSQQIIIGEEGTHNIQNIKTKDIFDS